MPSDHDTRWTAPAVLGVTVFLIYALTLYPSVAGGDAGELVSAAWTFGVPHPPGYPLFALLARAFATLPVGEVAWRMNLFSAVCAAAAAAVLAAAVALATGNRWAGVFAGGTFAFAPTVWEYATGAEVFALNNLLVALLLLFAVRYFRDGERRDALIGAFVFGLGMANHHTILFLGLPLVVLLIAREPKRWLSPKPLALLVACFAAGLLPYLYLPIAARTASLATWGDARSLSGFMTQLLRREYGTLRLGAGAYTAQVGFGTQLLLFGEFLLRELAFIAVPLAVIGAWAAWRSRSTRAIALWIVGSFALYTIVFHALANLPVDNPLFLGIQERFWLMPALLVAACAGLGVASLAARLGRWLAPAVIAVVAIQAGAHFVGQNHRGETEFREYGASFLRPLPPNAMLLARGDLIVNTTQYAQLVDGVRPDVRIVDLERLTYPWMRRVIVERMPDVAVPGDRLGPVAGGFTLDQLVASNAASHRVFVAGNLTPEEESRTSAYTRWPLGMTTELVPQTRAVSLDRWLEESRMALPRIDVPVRYRRARGTWANLVWQDVFGASHSRAVAILTLGIARDDTLLLGRAADDLAALTQAEPDVLPLAWRNLGLAYAYLARHDPVYDAKMRAAWTEYLARTNDVDQQTQTIRQILAQRASR